MNKVLDPLGKVVLFKEGSRYKYEHGCNTNKGDPFYYVYVDKRIRIKCSVEDFNIAFTILVECPVV
jgi:hypothetical protein